MKFFQHRKYVDPWDLDLREVSWRHSSDTTDCSADHQVVSLSSAAGPVSTRSEFVYVPGPAKSNKSGAGRTRARSVARYDCCQCSPSSSSLALVPPDPSKHITALLRFQATDWLYLYVTLFAHFYYVFYKMSWNIFLCMDLYA